MPRVHRVSFGLETCMFSPFQLHGESALRLAASAAMSALAQHGMSLQSMIHKHGLGLVILSAEVEYEAKLTFFSAHFYPDYLSAVSQQVVYDGIGQ